MPTTFNVFSLGTLPDFDPREGDFVAENAGAFVGATLGGPGNALAGRIKELTPAGKGFGGGFGDAYDQDGSPRESFRIDGGDKQTFDSVSVYDATLTYLDGSTATISAVLFQDTEGRVYLAPERSDNADQAALEAGPIESITLDRLVTNQASGLGGVRESGSFVPCFTPGAMIAAPGGARPVEGLAIGDAVSTAGGGAMAIRWIGRRVVPAQGRGAPVRISSGALGPGLPERDLTVSRQHRMLLRSPVAERMFGAPEVLVAAHRLTGLPGIGHAPRPGRITYIHLLLDQHEILTAHGAETESLLAGEMVRRQLGGALWRDLRASHPGLAEAAAEPARPIAEGRRAARLVARIARNGRPLVEPAGAQVRAAA